MIILGSSYDQFAGEVDFSRVSYPAGMDDIKRFEEGNKHLTINVLFILKANLRCPFNRIGWKRAVRASRCEHSSKHYATLGEWRDLGSLLSDYQLKQVLSKGLQIKINGNRSYSKTFSLCHSLVITEKAFRELVLIWTLQSYIWGWLN